MAADVELTVILPVFNGAATIEEQLIALEGQGWEGVWDVLVVNNGSTDATAEIVSEFCRLHPGRFRMELADARNNVSFARNEGVRRTSSRWLAFCDADDVVGVGWVSGMATALADNPLVGSRLDFMLLNDPDHGARQTFQTSKVESIFGIPAVASCGLGCHRDLWERLGGSDERMLAEDTDFSIRAFLHADVSPVLATAVYSYRLRREPRAEFRRSMRQARSEVQIFRAYGSDAHRPSGRSALRRWGKAFSSLRHVRTFDGRVSAARHWGTVLGRIRGSVAYRTLYL